MVMLNDAETGVAIPYSSVWATISKAGKVVYDERQWPMISRYMGPHYGNDVTLPGSRQLSAEPAGQPAGVRPPRRVPERLAETPPGQRHLPLEAHHVSVRRRERDPATLTRRRFLLGADRRRRGRRRGRGRCRRARAAAATVAARRARRPAGRPSGPPARMGRRRWRETRTVIRSPPVRSAAVLRRQRRTHAGPRAGAGGGTSDA